MKKKIVSKLNGMKVFASDLYNLNKNHRLFVKRIDLLVRVIANWNKASRRMQEKALRSDQNKSVATVFSNQLLIQ